MEKLNKETKRLLKKAQEEIEDAERCIRAAKQIIKEIKEGYSEKAD